MELYRQCKRDFCGGQIEWSVDIETGLEGTCMGCGRPAFRRKVDRTPPREAEAVEQSLIRLDRKHK